MNIPFPSPHWLRRRLVGSDRRDPSRIAPPTLGQSMIDEEETPSIVPAKDADRLCGVWQVGPASQSSNLWGNMTTRPELFRAKALECEQRAQVQGIGPLKDVLIEIAARWRLMADNVEQHENDRSSARHTVPSS